MTIDEIRRKKAEYGYSNEQMASLSGLPLSTVQKVLGGTTKTPRRSTLLALGSVFPKESAVQHGSIGPVYPIHGEDPSIFMVREPRVRYGTEASAEEIEEDNFRDEVKSQLSSRYPYQGSYTLDDYLALPADQRVELIDGIFYDMSAPTTTHQIVSGEIYYALRDYINSKGGSCIPFMSPVDVQLDCDNKTMIQPDVIVVCDRSKITRSRIVGAPDFVAEVLSPSTRRKDMFNKLSKYMKAGVKEYWMIDILEQKIVKWIFADTSRNPDSIDRLPVIYDFQDTVPVYIFNDECVIDFSEIDKSCSFIVE